MLAAVFMILLINDKYPVMTQDNINLHNIRRRTEALSSVKIWELIYFVALVPVGSCVLN